MDEIIHFTILFDIYNNLLTEKQQITFVDYFFENLTIEEIAKNNGISKNAVSKTIKTIKDSLEDFESKVKFLEYRNLLKEEFKYEEDILQRLSKYDII